MKRFTAAALLAVLFNLVAGPAVLAADENEKMAKVRESVKALLSDREPDSIAPSPMPGLYEVVSGLDLFYVSEDGDYMIQGNIIDMKQRKDITAPRQAQIKVKAVEAVGEDKMIIYSPKMAGYTVTVFTDIDCGFCRKLHAQMDEYNKKGIRIRYLFYPRAGLKSDSYRKAVSVWCADDQQKAMTLAKSGKEIEQRDCPNPVREHLFLGNQMGVRGTPSLVLEDGEMLPGYLPPDRLYNYLVSKQAGAKQ